MQGDKFEEVDAIECTGTGLTILKAWSGPLQWDDYGPAQTTSAPAAEQDNMHPHATMQGSLTIRGDTHAI